MRAIDLTKEEAFAHVMLGADNVMVQRAYPCDDEECGCTEADPCWFGIQKGDEEDGGWPEEWTRFQLWTMEQEYSVILRTQYAPEKLAEILNMFTIIEPIQIDRLPDYDNGVPIGTTEVVWQA